MVAHKLVTGGSHVLAQVVLQYCGQALLPQQLQVVAVEIVSDEYRGALTHCVQSTKDRCIASAHRPRDCPSRRKQSAATTEGQ